MNQKIDFFINWFTIGPKRMQILEAQKKKFGARDISIKIRGDKLMERLVLMKNYHQNER